MNGLVEWNYNGRTALRRVKRFVLGPVLNRLAASSVMPSKVRFALLRFGGVRIDPGVHIGRKVRFENREVHLHHGARIERGVRFEGVGLIEVAEGAQVPPGAILTTLRSTSQPGVHFYSPFTWGTEGPR